MNDLQQAADMARQTVTRYGMGDALGLASFEQPAAPLLSPAALQPRMPYSEHTAHTIDAEVAALLEEAHARVRATLTEKQPLLDALAHALLDQETLDRKALDNVLASSAAAPRRAVAAREERGLRPARGQ